MYRLILVCLLLSLSACTLKPKVPFDEAASLNGFPEYWTVQGRIAFKSPEEKFSASLNWQQQQQNYQLRLSKLIGGTLLHMEKTQQKVILSVDDQIYTDSNAERLIWQNTGWHIPVDDFKYWISGRLNPATRNITDLKQDEAGRIWSFTTQTGWRIKYQNYKVFAGKALPHNLVLSKENIQLKLRISDWTFNG